MCRENREIISLPYSDVGANCNGLLPICMPTHPNAQVTHRPTLVAQKSLFWKEIRLIQFSSRNTIQSCSQLLHDAMLPTSAKHPHTHVKSSTFGPFQIMWIFINVSLYRYSENNFVSRFHGKFQFSPKKYSQLRWAGYFPSIFAGAVSPPSQPAFENACITSGFCGGITIARHVIYWFRKRELFPSICQNFK